jgi:hypothetical protein
MHSYIVTGAAYDGSGTDLNPGVWVWGTVDCYRTAYMAAYWAAIQQANAVAGQSGVQQFLAPVLFAGALVPLGALTGPPSPSPILAVRTFQARQRSSKTEHRLCAFLALCTRPSFFATKRWLGVGPRKEIYSDGSVDAEPRSQLEIVEKNNA